MRLNAEIRRLDAGCESVCELRIGVGSEDSGDNNWQRAGEVRCSGKFDVNDGVGEEEGQMRRGEMVTLKEEGWRINNGDNPRTETEKTKTTGSRSSDQCDVRKRGVESLDAGHNLQHKGERGGTGSSFDSFAG